ncbi:hypothetical protein TRFO_34056 [Tritrichomonas foetus]|uniref:Uncharacterized protein n=1 Tax=Tritrichomonas foetus TaxID=1144522 RepID=A0A1J4JM62_9EUKA|nr:hypothetical protein TRFO_34056 [Tritrichomonas foetus]|eukprot:OHS99511.1 hypothetical protein TRFO_34056 [Tritrichomonas foetus]
MSFIRPFHNSNAIESALNILLRLNKITSILHTIDEVENQFFPIFLDLFLQIDTYESEIDINPLIHFFKIGFYHDIDFLEFLGTILSELNNSQTLSDKFKIEAIGRLSQTKEDILVLCLGSCVNVKKTCLLFELIFQQYSSIIPSDYLFIQPTKSTDFIIPECLDLNLGNVNNCLYYIFTIVAFIKDFSFITFIRDEKHWIQIRNGEIEEIVNFSINSIKPKRIVLLGYTKSLSYINSYYKFKKERFYDLNIFQFSSVKMKYLKIMKKTGISQKTLLDEIDNIQNDKNNELIYFKLENSDNFLTELPSIESLKTNKINVYFEKNSRYPLLSNLLIQNQNFMISIRFASCEGEKELVTSLFHVSQSAYYLYKFCKFFLRVAKINFTKLKLYTNLNHELEEISKLKRALIGQIFRNVRDPIVYFSYSSIL